MSRASTPIVRQRDGEARSNDRVKSGKGVAGRHVHIVVAETSFVEFCLIGAGPGAAARGAVLSGVRSTVTMLANVLE
jgi:hypothetical protein